MDIPDNRPRADLDAVDLQLLRLLSEDSRQSQRSLARELGMSPPAVAERMNRLERSGVIRSYSIDVDWGPFGLPLLAFIDVVTVQGAVQRRLLAQLSQLPSVHAVEITTGSSDLRVHLRVRDHTHLREVLFGEILPLADVERTDTLISLESMPYKNATADLLTSIIRSRAASNDEGPARDVDESQVE